MKTRRGKVRWQLLDAEGWVTYCGRADDVLGKPWVEDLDVLQVKLNLAISKEWEQTDKMARAPMVVPGGLISEDMADIDGYNILETEPAMGNVRPRVMEWPQSILVALRKIIEDKRKAMTGFTYDPRPSA